MKRVAANPAPHSLGARLHVQCLTECLSSPGGGFPLSPLTDQEQQSTGGQVAPEQPRSEVREASRKGWSARARVCPVATQSLCRQGQWWPEAELWGQLCFWTPALARLATRCSFSSASWGINLSVLLSLALAHTSPVQPPVLPQASPAVSTLPSLRVTPVPPWLLVLQAHSTCSTPRPLLGRRPFHQAEAVPETQRGEYNLHKMVFKFIKGEDSKRKPAIRRLCVPLLSSHG